MRKLFCMIAILIVAIMLVGIAASAQHNETADVKNNSIKTHVNPNPIAATVSEILANPVENQLITLEGQVTKDLGYGWYDFSDGTGMIKISAEEIPTSAFPLNTKLDVVGDLHSEDGVVAIEVGWVTPAPAPLLLSGVGGKTILSTVASPRM